MSPREIWCNEAQERYVLAIAPRTSSAFAAICERERCPFAVVGDATADGSCGRTIAHFDNTPVDMPLDVLLGKPPKMLRDVTPVAPRAAALRSRGDRLAEAAHACCASRPSPTKLF